NSDGKMDLLVRSTGRNQGCQLGGSSRIGLFLGNGDGSFQSEQPLARAMTCTTLKYIDGKWIVNHYGSVLGVPSTGDFNGDGRLDLRYQIDPGGTQIIIGRANGTFSIPLALGNSEPWGATFIAKDLDGDNLSDLVYLDSHS